MYNKVNLLFISITVIYNSLRVYTIGSIITHYDGITVANCGVSKYLPLPVNRKCFKWLDFIDEKQLASIGPNGRDALKDEFPWTAYLQFESDESWCTATVLNEQWILTAAHCMTGENVTAMRVLFGSNKENGEYEVDKHYAQNAFNDPLLDDIALIKLKTRLPISQTNAEYKINGICLPETGVLNNGSDLALVTGWGYRDVGQQTTSTLRVSPIVIQESDLIGAQHCRPASHFICGCTSREEEKLIFAGDSGAPMFQYANGRAVIIGFFTQSKLVTPVPNCAGILYMFTRVSTHIDWIRSVILQ